MVLSTVYLSKLKHKSAYWHFNTSLLQDGHFRDVFKYFWGDFRTTKVSFKSVQQWWDFAKMQIKQLCQQYTSSVTRDTTLRMKSLADDIMALQELMKNTGRQVCIENLRTKKNLLTKLLDVTAQGALVRSRFQTMECMDALSKFFFNLGKKNGPNKMIRGLFSDEGTFLVDHREIRKSSRFLQGTVQV